MLHPVCDPERPWSAPKAVSDYCQADEQSAATTIPKQLATVDGACAPLSSRMVVDARHRGLRTSLLPNSDIGESENQYTPALESGAEQRFRGVVTALESDKPQDYTDIGESALGSVTVNVLCDSAQNEHTKSARESVGGKKDIRWAALESASDVSSSITSFNNISTDSVYSVIKGMKNLTDPMICRGRLMQRTKGKTTVTKNVSVLLDTGAGESYYVCDNIAQESVFDMQPVQCLVEVADGRRVSVKHAIECTLSLLRWNKSRTVATRRVTVKVLPASSEAAGSLIGGRSLIALFGISLDGVSRARIGRYAIYDCSTSESQVAALNVPTDIVRFCDNTGTIDANTDSQQSQCVPLHPPLAVDDCLQIAVDDSVRRSNEEILCRVQQRGWVPIPYFADAKVRLRRAEATDILDTKQQTYVWEISLPNGQYTAHRPRNYSQKMFEAMTIDDKKEFMRLVNDYVVRGWWTRLDTPPNPCGVGHSDVVIGPANVFCVRQGKMRLVCDFSPSNALLPVASSALPSINHMLLQVWLSQPRSLLTGDCSAAFYRVHMCQKGWLICGNEHYVTHRLSFGYSFGPCGLLCSLGELFRMFQSSEYASTTSCIFADDFVLTSDKDHADMEESMGPLLNLLQSAGFDIPRRKFHLSQQQPSRVTR